MATPSAWASGRAAEDMAAVDDILDVLHEHGIDEQPQKDVVAIAWSLKPDIMHL